MIWIGGDVMCVIWRCARRSTTLVAARGVPIIGGLVVWAWDIRATLAKNGFHGPGEVWHAVASTDLEWFRTGTAEIEVSRALAMDIPRCIGVLHRR